MEIDLTFVLRIRPPCFMTQWEIQRNTAGKSARWLLENNYKEAEQRNLLPYCKQMQRKSERKSVRWLSTYTKNTSRKSTKRCLMVNIWEPSVNWEPTRAEEEDSTLGGERLSVKVHIIKIVFFSLKLIFAFFLRVCGVSKYKVDFGEKKLNTKLKKNLTQKVSLSANNRCHPTIAEQTEIKINYKCQ